MYYSYDMGLDNSIKELEQENFIIEQDQENYKVTFPKEKEKIWEEFISKHLKEGYWNEYLKESEVVFLFSLKEGIKKVVVKNYQDDEVLKLCEQLAEAKFKNIKEMLKGNDFYKDKIK